MTSALDGVEWSVSCSVRFPPVARTQVPIGREAGWVPESVRTLWSNEKSLVPAVNRTPAVQPVAKATEPLLEFRRPFEHLKPHVARVPRGLCGSTVPA
jgi:hypothetical protein